MEALEAAGVDDPRLDAELLLAAAIGIDRAELYADPERELEPPSGAEVLRPWCGGACGASRSPTSSAARTFASSSWWSTAAC